MSTLERMCCRSVVTRVGTIMCSDQEGGRLDPPFGAKYAQPDNLWLPNARQDN